MATSDPDPRIIRLRPKRVAARLTNLSEMVDALDDRASALHCGRDRRKGFAECYARHAELVEALRRAGVFGSAAGWIERLMLEQASQYFRALDAWDGADFSLTPAPWRAVYARARYEDIPDDELSRLSAVVHTAYDLPLALARCPFEESDATEAHAAFERLPALVISETAPRGSALPWRRRPLTSDISLRARAWEDGMRLLDVGDAENLRAAFIRMETRVLLRVAG
ncbi:MAG: DUF5995 family protein [Dehalococcoidia bacterium]